MISGLQDALTIILVVVASEGLGWIAVRLGQPKVLGELTTGLVLGASLLGVLDPQQPVIAAVGEIGLLVLLFEIGLETDIRGLVHVGAAAATVGLAGVILPLVLGTGVGFLFGLGWLPALMCGAALTATSIGISARVLRDVGRIHSIEGRVVLGAAVLDDVAGLVILAGVTAVATAEIAATAAAGGPAAGPEAGSGASPLASVALLAAFAAGMVLHRTRWRLGTERAARVLGFVVVPVFFAVVGAGVQIRSVGGAWPLALGLALLVVGVAGKFAAGYAPRKFRGNRALVGLAMVPRGEVGLVFAATGSALGVFDRTLYSVVTLVVMATTFFTPPLLARMVRREPATHAA